ncbi:MAG TPA: hypothetical protein VHZ73_13290 [Vicinamibacterales bacterium]|jgi:hypothetical protein|nr:hypothetical protein [Vicinamibacterales bacterium]
MEVSDTELRDMVRAAIVRQSGAIAGTGSAAGAPMPAVHASHGLLPLARGGDADGACIIEPSVRCTHCGYCLSYGH